MQPSPASAKRQRLDDGSPAPAGTDATVASPASLQHQQEQFNDQQADQQAAQDEQQQQAEQQQQQAEQQCFEAQRQALLYAETQVLDPMAEDEPLQLPNTSAGNPGAQAAAAPAAETALAPAAEAAEAAPSASLPPAATAEAAEAAPSASLPPAATAEVGQPLEQQREPSVPFFLPPTQVCSVCCMLLWVLITLRACRPACRCNTSVDQSTDVGAAVCCRCASVDSSAGVGAAACRRCCATID